MRDVGERIFWIANFAAMATCVVLAGVAVAYLAGRLP
jgi:hypothetical protein